MSYVNTPNRATLLGSPPTHVAASVLVGFLPSGAPFCCGEPGCYSHVFCESGAEDLGDYLRRKMNLRHTVTSRFNATLSTSTGSNSQHSKVAQIGIGDSLSAAQLLACESGLGSFSPYGWDLHRIPGGGRLTVCRWGGMRSPA